MLDTHTYCLVLMHILLIFGHFFYNYNFLKLSMDERHHNVNAHAVSGRDNEHLICYSSYIAIFLTVAWLKRATNINIDMCLIKSRLVAKELYQRKLGSLVIIAMKWNLEWYNILDNIVIALEKNINVIFLDALMSRTRRSYIYLGMRRSCNCMITAAVIRYKWSFRCTFCFLYIHN